MTVFLLSQCLITHCHTRQRRSLSFFRNIFDRVLNPGEVSSRTRSTDISFSVQNEEDVINVVQCSLILLKKTCTSAGVRSICTNHFGRKCYSFIYPKVTTTVETDDEDDERKLEKLVDEDTEVNTLQPLY